MFRFKCATCDQWHEGMPSYGAEAPLSYYGVPENERAQRCVRSTDFYVIDEKWFFIRGCLEIPVHGEARPFTWGAWVSVSRNSIDTFADTYEDANRAHIPPFFGWLDMDMPLYPSTVKLKTMVHLRDNRIRPYIELEPTDHPLAVEQREGISAERVAEICAYFVHGGD